MTHFQDKLMAREQSGFSIIEVMMAAGILGIISFVFLQNMAQNNMYRVKVEKLEEIRLEMRSITKRFFTQHFFQKLVERQCQITATDIQSFVDYRGAGAEKKFTRVQILPWNLKPNQFKTLQDVYENQCSPAVSDGLNKGAGEGEFYVCLAINNVRSLNKGANGRSFTGTNLSKNEWKRAYARINFNFKSMVNNSAGALGTGLTCRDFIKKSSIKRDMLVEAHVTSYFLTKFGGNVRAAEVSQTYIFNNSFIE